MTNTQIELVTYKTAGQKALVTANVVLKDACNEIITHALKQGHLPMQQKEGWLF